GGFDERTVQPGQAAPCVARRSPAFHRAMLVSLRIRNLALVEELEWQPGPGFVAITGETGSGKSIIVGALKLVLGERADKSLIRSGAESCSVEAVFQPPDATKLNGWLE